ncbi:MAG TPA: cupin domain-containing protein [Rhodothermales bacterium]|nr:cupin domain-containing protein [Rhodothermales bacterium]
MRVGKLSRGIATATVLSTVLLGGAAEAAVSEVIAVGTMAHSELLDGPATMTVRRLTIAPGEVLGWHYHPGIGAYTIVKSGALIVEDGCGGEVLYTEGQAFVENPNRVHRGKNLTASPVVTVQTFLVPTGTPISVSTPKLCGAPASVDECRNDGWLSFNHPRPFKSQGDCSQYVITGR